MRQWIVKALKVVRQDMAINNEAFVKACVGAGKTTLGATLAKEYNKVLVVTPATAINSQWSSNWGLKAVCPSAIGRVENGLFTEGKQAQAFGSAELVIFDEAHHFQGKDSGLFRSLVAMAKVMEKDSLFLSATPLDGTSCSYSYSYKDALADGVVTAIACHKIAATVSPLEASPCRFATSWGVEPIRNTEGRSIVFCDSVASAEAMQKAVGYGIIAHSLSKEGREGLTRFQNGEGKVLFVYKSGKEGYDVPSVENLFFYNCSSSALGVEQAIGRGIRLDDVNPNKICNVYAPSFSWAGSDKNNSAYEKIQRAHEAHPFNIVKNMQDDI